MDVSTWGSKYGDVACSHPNALHGDAREALRERNTLGEVVPYRIVLNAAVVPEHQGARLPMDPALNARLFADLVV